MENVETSSLTERKRILLLCIVALGISFQCTRPLNLDKENLSKKIETIILNPDTTINNQLILHNYNSFENFYSNLNEVKFNISIRESSVVVFCNASKTEYLLAYQYEGNTLYSFSCFEIIPYDGRIQNCISLSSCNAFITESGIKLGLSLKELEMIKGRMYLKKDNNILYQINDTNSSFLKRYNMPEYFLKIELLNEKVRKIKFGFEYP